MGLFDTVRSLFGSDEESADEHDDRPDEQSSDDAGTDPDVEAGESESVGEADIDEPSIEAEDPSAEGDEQPGDTDEPSADADEPTEEDTGETVAGDESTDEDEEKISWEETGFEQLTDELVEDDEDEGDDVEAADLIQEAEPDRVETTEPRPGSEPDASATDVERESDTDESVTTDGETDTDDGLEPTDEAEPQTGPNLPLDEEEAAAMTDDAGTLDDVDVPEDSTRAAFVEEAVDLAEFWGEYDLDFTVDSLARVDELIAEQWGPDRFADAEYGGEGYDSEVFTGLVSQVGSYLGEVLLRVHGGEWRDGDDDPSVDLPAEAVAGEDTTVAVFDVARTALVEETTLAAAYEVLVAGPEGTGSAPTIDPADVDAVSGGEDDRGDAPDRLRAGGEDLAERWPDYDLDFTVESLSRLEALLDAEVDGERFVDAELGDETDRESMLLTAHAVGVGGYFAEVLRRERGASWDTARMVLLVETDDGETAIDPIDTAVACIRGEGSLVEAVP